MKSLRPLFRVRSFVRRDSRMTAAQSRAYEMGWPRYGCSLTQGLVPSEKLFGRIAPCYLEIGFGSGQSLLALAKSQPDNNFIGVETHKPGLGALLLGMQQHDVTNLRLYHADVMDVLTQGISTDSLDGIHIFFPDPWPKRRHHARRLIQPDFIALLVTKMKPHATLHIATDWEDYASHMMRVLSQEKKLRNTAGEHHFAERSLYRPLITKFEQRALKAGRRIWELQFEK